jgi:hypothetical protein
MTAFARLMIWVIVVAAGVWSGPALADRILEGRVTVVRDVNTIVWPAPWFGSTGSTVPRTRRGWAGKCAVS